MIRNLLAVAFILAVSVAVVVGTVIDRSYKHTTTMTTDTLADTTSGDGLTNHYDTVGLFQPKNWQSFWLRLYLKPSEVTTHGIGLHDSAQIALVRMHWGVAETLAAETASALGSSGLPCSLTYYFSAGSDTVKRGDWSAQYQIIDSTTDSLETADYDLQIEYEALLEPGG